MRHRRVLGIDPGASGGWAVVNFDGTLLGVGVFPTHTVKRSTKNVTMIDGVGLAALFDAANPTHAFVENVHSRPRQAGQFNFGLNTGIVHGLIYAAGVDMHLVSPASWKAIYGIKRTEDETKADKKSQARQIAATIYPQHAHLFKRVKDDGVAEAVLIALYGLECLQRDDEATRQ